MSAPAKDPFSLCVFCGASPGVKPAYIEAARALGCAIAQSGCRLVFGGGRVGLMGAVAQAALEGGAAVTGVIPEGLVRREIALHELDDLRIVASMHERKALMAELADAFIALPGGLGTLEEFAEAMTWTQLGLHAKPCGLLNACGFFDPFLAFLRQMADEGFMQRHTVDSLPVSDDPSDLIDRLRRAPTPHPDKVRWILDAQKRIGIPDAGDGMPRR